MNIQHQVLGAQLRAVAEEMGAVLVRSAFSANIKERRDCSTALFDERGRMIVQAEHIPVHLGAMPEAVAAVLVRDPQPGETFVVNDPFTGGTHLPDITLVSRVPCGLACSRAHHADVGGMEPASLPAGSTDIYQEGLVLPPVRLDDELLTVLLANMRNPDERRGDLNAQLAAHRLAERRLADLVERRGAGTVSAAMDELYRYSERVVRAAIARLPDGRYEARDTLEPATGELEIRVAVTIAGDEIEIDFTGTSAQHEGNLNCPLAVTRSACYFVVRCLTEPELPSSGGAYAPVRVTASEGSLVNALPPAAVVAGNTETSSRIVDVVLSAFGEAVPVPAQGQGTMNNVTFGNRSFTYYETIGAGRARARTPTGRTPFTSRCRTRSTRRSRRSSSRIRCAWSATSCDEARAGREHTEAATASSASSASSRTAAYPSLPSAGRTPRPGETVATKARPAEISLNGEELPAKVSRSLRAGDVLRIETPGGGGHGQPT